MNGRYSWHQRFAFFSSVRPCAPSLWRSAPRFCILAFDFPLCVREKNAEVLASFYPHPPEDWPCDGRTMTFYPFLVVAKREGRDQAVWLPKRYGFLTDMLFETARKKISSIDSGRRSCTWSCSKIYWLKRAMLAFSITRHSILAFRVEPC